MEDFQIHFDNRPNETYFCGETVRGHVSLSLEKEMRLKALEIKFGGKSEVLWTETQLYLCIGHSTVTYAATETTMNNTVVVLGGKDNDEITLPPGEYTYNFAVILPQELPSSFEGKYGRVRYTVKAKIVRSWKVNYEIKKAYTVSNVMDLNTLDHVKLPQTATIEKSLCCWFCKSGTVTLAVSLPFTGFVPGQRVQMLLEVDNQSSSQVKVNCNLVQKIIYVAPVLTMGLCDCCVSKTPKSKESKRIVKKEELGIVNKMASNNFQPGIVIPPLPASFLNNCYCIYLEYFLEFVASFDGMHVPATLTVPIVIGTIPLRDHFHSILPADSEVPPSSAEEVSSPSALPAPVHPDLPLPSYEKSLAGSADIRNGRFGKHLEGENIFTPRYPVYRFQ